MSAIKGLGGASGTLNFMNVFTDAFPALSVGLNTFISSLSSATTIAGIAKSVISGLWTVISAHPIISTAIAIGALVVIFDKLNVTAQESAEALSNMQSSYDDNKSKLESLNSELATTQSRMDELQAKGHLTLTEQEELANLQAQNAELERTISLKEAQQKIDAKKLASQAEDTYKKWTTVSDFFGNEMGSSSYNKQSVQNYQEQFSAYGSVDKINAIKSDAIKKWWQGNSSISLPLDAIDLKGNADNINYLIGVYESLQVAQKNVATELDTIAKKGSNATEDELKQAQALQEYYDSLGQKSIDAQSYMNDYIDVISQTYSAYKEAESQGVITDIQKAQLQEMQSFMTDYMKLITNTAGDVETAINNLFAKSQFINLKEQLVSAGKSGESVLQGIISKTPGLTKALDDAGISAQQLSDYIMAIADPDSLKIDVIKQQLKDAFLSDDYNKNFKMGEYADKAWNEFIGDKSDREVEIFYKYVNENNLDISDWASDDLNANFKQAIGSIQQEINSIEPITLSSLLSPDAEGNQSALSKTVDDFQSNMSTIQGIFESINKGEKLDLGDIGQQLPELAGATDNLEESLSSLQIDKVKDFASQYKSLISGITDPQELAKAQQYFQDILSSIDLSNVNADSLRNQVLDMIWSGSEASIAKTIRTENIMSEFRDELQAQDGLEILFKILADPSNADKNIQELRSQYENDEITMKVRVIEDLQNDLSVIQDESSRLQSNIDNKTALGIKVKNSDYAKLIKNGNQQISNLKQQIKATKALQQEYDKGSKTYKSYQNKIDNLSTSIDEMTVKQYEWHEAMQNLPVTNAQNLSSALSSAMSDLQSETGLTSEAIKELNTQFSDLEGYDPSIVFYASAKGVQANTYALKDFINQQNAIQEGKFADEINRQKDAITAYQNQIGSGNTDSKLQSMQNNLEGLLQRQAQYFAQYKSQMEQLSDFQAIQNAKNTKNAGSNYDQMISDLKAAKKAYDKDLVGTDDFKTVAKYLSPNGFEDAANFAENYAKAQRYLTEDSSKGVVNFLEDLKKKGYATYETLSNGAKQWSLNIADAKKAAMDMGMGEEFFTDVLNKTEDYGFVNATVTSLSEGSVKIEEANTKLVDAYAKLAEMQASGASTDAIEQQKEVIASLEDHVINLTTATENYKEVSAQSYAEGLVGLQEQVSLLEEARKKALSSGNKDLADGLQNVIQSIADKYDVKLDISFDGSNISINKDSYNKALKDAGIGSFENPLTASDYGFMKGSADSTYLEGATNKIIQQKDALQDYFSVLSQYSAEDLRSIILDNDKYDVSGLEVAEDALEGIASAGGLSTSEITQLVNALEAVGVLKPRVNVNTQDVDEGITKLEEMQKAGQISTDIAFNVDITGLSNEELSDRLEKLTNQKAGMEHQIELGLDVDMDAYHALESLITQTEMQVKINTAIEEAGGVDELLALGEDGVQAAVQCDDSEIDGVMEKLQSIKDGTDVPITVKMDEDQFSQLIGNKETSTITVDADNEPAKDKIDEAVKYGESQKIEIPVTTEPIDTSGISNGASAEDGDGINVKVHVDSSEVDNYVPADKEAEVVYKKDSHIPDNYQPANKSAIAKYNVNAKSVYDWTPPTKRGEVVYTVKVNGTVPHNGVEGEFASGTMISPAHASGTAYNVLNMQSIGAYAGGNVALPKDQKALVNEEQINGHSESIVRDGKWFLIPGGAHVENLKKGDLIFSAKQTDDLLKHGRTAGHANAYAQGTLAYSGMPAHATVGGGMLGGNKYAPGNATPSSAQKSYQQNTQSVNQNTTAVDENTDATDHSTSTFDWVATRLEVFANKVQSIADTITDYVSSAFKKSRLKMQISAIDNQIAANKRAAATYMQVADELAAHYEYYDENGNKQSLTIPEEYKLKVQQGDWLVEEMDTSTDFNKNLAEAIQKYQEYYDKANECSTAVQELKNNQMDLFNDLINIPIEEAEKKIDRIAAKMDVLDAAASAITGQSGLSRYSYQIEADAGMKRLSEELDSAKTKTKSSIEEAKKAARNSGDSAVKDYIYKQIKNGKYIDTKNLTGNAKKTAEQYNTDLQNQRKVQEQYNTKKKALSDTQKLILNNEGKPTYAIQNAILGENLKNKRDESKEYANAAKQAEKNRVSTEKDLNATTKKVEKYASDMLKNSNVTKFLNASQINALKNGGEVDTTGIVDPTILRTLKNYNILAEEKRTAEEKDTIALNALTEAQKNATISKAEYAQMAVENEQQKFANIKDYYDSKIDYNQALQQNQESKISRKKALGASASKSELERQRKLMENEEKLYIQQRDKLEEQLNKSVASGAIKEGSEEWKALRAEILAADTAANNAASSIANVANEIANIKLDQLEKTKSLFDAIISCCDSVVSMIETAGKYAYNDQDAMNALKGQIDYYEKKANNNLESAQENYANYAAAEANNGTYGGKSSEEWLTDYYNSLTEYYNTKGNQYALDKEIRELPLQEMNGALGNLKSVLDVITSGADLKEAEGKYLDIMDYQNQIANYSQQIAKQQQINAQYQSLYEQMMAIGADARAAEYYDQWQSGVAELNKMSASVEELSDKIRDDFVESVKRSIDAISDMRDVLESELDIKKSEGKYLGYSDYSDQIRLNSQEYSNQLQIMTDRRKKYSEALLAGNQAEADQMLSEARQAEASANKLLAANAELEKSIQNLFRDTLQRELDALESAQAVLESQMNLIDAQSRDKTKDNFQQQIDMNMDLIHKQEALARENQRLYNLEVSKGNMEAAAEYLKAWKSADAEVNNLRADIEGLGDDMREALLTKDIDKLLDRMEQLRNSMSTISSIINEDMMFDDNGRMTEFGITALAMDIKTYESETDSLKKLIEKRQKYIEEYNNGMNEYYSKNEYDEDMKNISQEIQEMLSDANTTRQAIVEMVAKTSKMEIDALNDVIDKRKELLQAQKDAYDFDKTLKSQTNDLTLLQKQKEALEGLTDKESQAKLQKLNKQIKEAQETLNDTITDHSFDLKIDGLDDLKQDISDAYDEYVKQLNANLEAITSTVTDAANTVVGSLGTVTEAITKLLNSYGISGLDTDTIGYTRQYAKGTKNHPGGSAIVNDGNGLETVVLPDGSVLLPYLPKGSDVISAENTKRLLSNIATQPINAPKIETPKLDVKAVLNGNDGQQVTVGDVQININDTVDADNVMSVINKNINDIAKGVGNAFSKGVNKSSGRKSWG